MNSEERIKDLELKFSDILEKIEDLQNQVLALKHICANCGIDLLKSDIATYLEDVVYVGA